MDIAKLVRLVNISKYAEEWGISRDAVYDRIKGYTENSKKERTPTDVVLTAYQIEGEEEKTLVNIEENPQVRPYNREGEEAPKNS